MRGYALPHPAGGAPSFDDKAAATEEPLLYFVLVSLHQLVPVCWWVPFNVQFAATLFLVHFGAPGGAFPLPAAYRAGRRVHGHRSDGEEGGSASHPRIGRVDGARGAPSFDSRAGPPPRELPLLPDAAEGPAP